MSVHLKLRKLTVLLLITGILILVAQTKFVIAQSNIPQIIHSCLIHNRFGTNCFNWRWNGSYYEFIDSEGETMSGIVMEVERFDRKLVEIYQVPIVSSEIDPVKRREVSYRGHPNGNQIIDGVAIRKRGWITYTWNARW